MWVSRRQFFRRFGESLAGNLASAYEAARDACVDGAAPATPASTWLRPPGALDEEAFRSACTRCTACYEACPHDALRRLGPEFGEDAGTPAIIVDQTPCYLCEDLPCVVACEPAALRFRRARDATMGTALLDRASCYLSTGQPCDYCVRRCPLKDKAIAFGSDGVPVVDEDVCVGCGVCAFLCPANAIRIHPERLKRRVATGGVRNKQ